MPHLLTRCAAATLTLAVAAVAQDAAPAPATPERTTIDAPAAGEPWAFTLLLENDSAFFKWNPSDRYYTHGTALTFAHQPRWADDLAPHMPFAEQFGPARTAAGYVVSQLLFTPDVITADIPDPDDRPYAGVLYGGVYWQREGTHGDVATLDHFQLDLGVVGPSALAEQAQRNTHDVFGGDDPNGWDSQLADEPLAQLTIRKKWRFDVVEPTPDSDGLGALGVQVIPAVGGTVGNVWRYLEAGATARVGVNLPDDFGPARIADLGSFTGQQGTPPRGRWSAYLFGRASGRFVEHDLTFEGNSYKDSAGVAAEEWVGELQAGFEVAYGWDRCALALGYSQTFLTEQFDGQDGWHSIGAYTLRFVAEF